MARLSKRAGPKARAEIRHQHATRRLAQRGRSAPGVGRLGRGRIVLGLVGFLWMAVRCGTLFPNLF
jgi:hypothetical protein